jgi:hypothetical protein
MEKEKENANIRRAIFHSEIYHDDVDRIVEAYSDQKTRETLLNILSQPEFQRVDDQTYFGALSQLHSIAAWQHLVPADKVRFFKNWYVAISEEYIKAFSYFRRLHPNFNGLAYYLDAAMHDEKKFTDYFGIKSDDLIAKLRAACGNLFWKDIPETDRYLYVLCRRVFGMHIDKAGMERDLRLSFRKQLVDRLDNVSAFSLETVPAWISTDSMNAETLMKLRRQVGVVPIFINVKYEVIDILESIKALIKKEQDLFFSQCLGRKSIYMKKDTLGRKDTYPFDEWARYLEIYILKQQGNKTDAVMQRFYPNFKISGADPYRQLRRDIQKAKKLSHNAITGIFPGKYSK